MTDSKIIQLSFDRQDFEEIYFRNNQGDIYWGQSVKKYFIIVLVLSGLLAAGMLYCALTNQFWWIPVLLFSIWVVGLYRYLKQIAPITKWKRQVKNYLNELSKFNSHKLSLSNDALSIIRDTSETIIKWRAISTATLEDNYISVTSNETLILPKRSMRESDYRYLKEIITEKLKNGS